MIMLFHKNIPGDLSSQTNYNRRILGKRKQRREDCGSQPALSTAGPLFFRITLEGSNAGISPPLERPAILFCMG
tara:strand:- start:416 stop:637 length:222 start_codon:yes stop_codon:yes gene_type:complete